MIISRIKTEIIRILILYIYICMFQNTFNGQKRQRITRLLNLFLRYFSLGLKANRIGNTSVAFIDASRYYIDDSESAREMVDQNWRNVPIP